MPGTFEPLRLGLSLIAGLALAAAAGLHAASAIATRSAPDLAARLFPANAQARELAAFARFKQAVSDPAELSSAAASVEKDAREVLRDDPTSAKALALLALAKPDIAERHASAIAASRINRRDLTLQGLVLDAHLAASDYPAAVETLDQILRVHRGYLAEFAPVLGRALREDATVPVFARLLDGSSPWHVYFYRNYALGDPELLPNLARLRSQRSLVDEEFDRILIAQLAQHGHTEQARSLFTMLSETRETAAGSSAKAARSLGWEARFPPFDWRFADATDFRAQTSRDGTELEIFARPGRGGVIAERVLEMPDQAFRLATDLTIESTSRSDAVRIEVSCKAGGEPFAAMPLSNGQQTLSVERPPACEEMAVKVHARAWSGGTSLRARMAPIELSPL